MITTQQALKKFLTLPPEITYTVDSDLISERMTHLNEKYNVNLGSLIIFLTIGELEIEQIPLYLKKELNLEESTATELQKEFIEKIYQPIKERLNLLNANPEKNFSLSQEKILILKIFKYTLVNELKDHPLIINSINARIFKILSKDLSFKTELEKALYENNQKVTPNKLTIENDTTEPTVTNWIKDLIKHYGTGNFNDISLSKFLTDTPNTKHLDDYHRTLLSLVIKTYKNIKFFPESMPNDTGENWEIIPINKTAPTSTEPKPTSRKPLPIPGESIKTKQPTETQTKTPPQATPTTQTPTQAKTPPQATPKQAPPTPSPFSSVSIRTQKPPKPPKPKYSNPREQELQDMASMYPPNSLERKAIEQEIKKLEN